MCPGGAAVVGDSEVVDCLLFLRVIAAGDDAVLRIAKGDRKDSGRLSRGEWRIGNLPGAAAVGGVQDARFSCGAGADTRGGFAEERDVGAARGKRAFVFLGRGQILSWNSRPRISAISGGQYVELLID